MRTPQELFFDSFDQTRLFYRYWPALSGDGKRAILLFHRGHEHSGRLQHLVDELDLPEFACFAWDARGYGHSPGPRGYSPSLGTSVKDLDSFVQHVSASYGIAPSDMAVVAQSVGSVQVVTWVHDYAPRVRCLVLASPAFKVKLYVPFARPGLRLLQALRGNFYVNSYVKARYLTHDPERIASYNSDPLITRPISVNILLALYEAADRVVRDAGAILTPTQLLISGGDWVVHIPPQREFFRRLGSPIKEEHEFPGFYHDTFGELERRQPIGRAREFILRLFAQPIQYPSRLDADLHGETRDEYDALQRPLPLLSLKGLQYAFTRGGLRLGALVSDGLRLGLTTGFDSGSTLDYVYRNQPSGRTALGRFIDRTYLDSPGWRGIRVRKQHLETLLRRAMELIRAKQQPVRLLDIAAGHGRYVLDAIAGEPRPEQILLRDFSELNQRLGRALIEERSLGEIARFELGDAFDRASLAAIRPHPNLGIVSGLYELFPANAQVRDSLAGLAEALEPGGYLIYTGQPWHPQLELIARALTSHRGGAPWVMRRRTQAELDQLVEASGFRKLDQLTDDWGIFTVSLAERLES